MKLKEFTDEPKNRDAASVERELTALLDDSAFERLENELKTPNIFSILKMESMEIRHSNFIAWLLDPHESPLTLLMPRMIRRLKSCGLM
jgi:hypothetical protein